MCKLTTFSFLCGASKFKIAEPCSHAATNYQGVQFCRLDPHAHPDDGVYPRDNVVASSHGPGVCHNANCRRHFAIDPDLADEDDAAFDMSDEAGREREDRWYRRCLTTEQQLEFLSVRWAPYGAEWTAKVSWHRLVARVPEVEYRRLVERGVVCADGEDVAWFELNPRYMSSEQLQMATGLFLPQTVTDTRARLPLSASPFKPMLGPFRVRDHSCAWIRDGFCRDCGRWRGPGLMPERTLHGGNDWRGFAEDVRRMDIADLNRSAAQAAQAASGPYLHESDEVMARRWMQTPEVQVSTTASVVQDGQSFPPQSSLVDSGRVVMSDIDAWMASEDRTAFAAGLPPDGLGALHTSSESSSEHVAPAFANAAGGMFDYGNLGEVDASDGMTLLEF